MEEEKEIIVAKEREHAIDMRRDEVGDSKESANGVEEEKKVGPEAVEVKRSRRVAALDAFRGLTIVVR